MTHFHQPVDARLQAKAGAGAGAAGTGTAAAHLALWRSGGKGCFPRYFNIEDTIIKLVSDIGFGSMFI